MQNIQSNSESPLTSSQDSLDYLLPKIHAKTPVSMGKIQKEQDIINYLKGLGIRFKTDPRTKERHYFENVTIQFIREAISPLTPIGQKASPLQIKQQQETFSLKENPLIVRRASKE